MADHDSAKVLARSKYGQGTLKLEVDHRGLKYSFTAPETTTGNDLLESIKRGDIDQSSFQFRVATGGEKREALPEGGMLRTITKIDLLLDVSPVCFAAYTDTTVQARSVAASTAEDFTITNARRAFEFLGLSAT